MEGELWERILEALTEVPQVALAYPTQRVNLDGESLAELVPKELESVPVNNETKD